MEIKDFSGGEGGLPTWGKISGTWRNLAGEPNEWDIDWDEDVNKVTLVKVDGRTRKPGLGKAKR